MMVVMKKIIFTMMVLAVSAGCAQAASEADYLTAFTAAESANKEAGRLRNQWTVTQAALTAAKKAAETGNFDQALKSAQEAEALAKASIAQATSEKQRWKDLEIR